MATILGIDFGNSRIGLALGENGFSVPLKIVTGKNWEEALREIQRIVQENFVSFIVLGLPKKETIGVIKFENYLKSSLNVPIKLVDEDFTSKEALEYSIQMGFSKKGRKYLDDVSACLILERFFKEYEYKN